MIPSAHRLGVVASGSTGFLALRAILEADDPARPLDCRLNAERSDPVGDRGGTTAPHLHLALEIARAHNDLAWDRLAEIVRDSWQRSASSASISNLDPAVRAGIEQAVTDPRAWVAAPTRDEGAAILGSSSFQVRALARLGLAIEVARAATRAEAWCPPEAAAKQWDAVAAVISMAGDDALGGRSEAARTTLPSRSYAPHVASDSNGIVRCDAVLASIDEVLHRQALQAEALLLLGRIERATGRNAVRMNTFEAVARDFDPAAPARVQVTNSQDQPPDAPRPVDSLPSQETPAGRTSSDPAPGTSTAGPVVGVPVGRTPAIRATERLLRLCVLIMHRMVRFREATEVPERLSLRRAIKQAEDRYLDAERAVRVQVVALTDELEATLNVGANPDRKGASGEPEVSSTLRTEGSSAPRPGWTSFALLDPALISLIARQADRLWEVEALRRLHARILPVLRTWRADLEREIAAAAERCCLGLAGDLLGDDGLVLAVDETAERSWSLLAAADQVVDRNFAFPRFDRITPEISDVLSGDDLRIIDSIRERCVQVWTAAWIETLVERDPNASEAAQQEARATAERTAQRSLDDLAMLHRSMAVLRDGCRGLQLLAERDVVIDDLLERPTDVLARTLPAARAALRQTVLRLTSLSRSNPAEPVGLAGDPTLSGLLELVERDHAVILVRGALAAHAEVMRVDTHAGDPAATASARPPGRGAAASVPDPDALPGGETLEWLGPDLRSLVELMDAAYVLDVGGVTAVWASEAYEADRDAARARRDLAAQVRHLRGRWSLLEQMLDRQSMLPEPLL